MEQGDSLGDVFDKRRLSTPSVGKTMGEMRIHDGEEKMVALTPDGLKPVKVILSDRGIIHDSKGHCNTLSGERPYA